MVIKNLWTIDEKYILLKVYVVNQQLRKFTYTDVILQAAITEYLELDNLQTVEM